MSDEVKELDSSAIMEALPQQERMPLTELAQSIGAPFSEAKARAMAVLNDIAATDDEVVLKLTSQERKDLKALEKKVANGQRDSIAALREIRDRRLYREDYSSFDEYLAQWHRTRQWASQQIQWLRRVELLEAATGKIFLQSHLSAHEVRALAPLDDLPELYVAAIRQADAEAERTGKKRSAKMVQAAVKRLTDFAAARTSLGVPDLTYEENRSLARLGLSRMPSPNLVAEALEKSAADGRPVADCLAETCEARHGLPRDEQLLVVARGEQIEAIVAPLAALKSAWDEQDKIREKQRTLEEQADEAAEQSAPSEPAPSCGERAEYPASEFSDAAVSGVEEEESDAETGPAYRVQLTGAFEALARDCLDQGDAEMELDRGSLADLLSLFAEKIGEGFEIGEESSITVLPLAANETDDEEQEDEDTEGTEDEDAGGE
jgi:hypothetical protein